MKETKTQKALGALCDTFAGDCFRLCLLDLADWADAETALRNTLIRFRKTGAAKKNVIAARQVLAAETLHACRAFRNDRKKDALAGHTCGTEEQTALLAALLARPRTERVALGLSALLDLMPAEIAGLLRQPEAEIARICAAEDLPAVRTLLQQITPDATRAALIEALRIGATATPEYKVAGMTAVVAAVMLINALGLVLLYRLVIADQPVPDYYGDDTALSFAESSEFTVLYNELLNELSAYEYNTITYYPASSLAMTQELLPLYEGMDGENTDTGTQLAERSGYTIGSLYGEGACAFASTTVCRYTKMVYNDETGGVTYTNQEYLVWYDGQADGMNLSTDRIYRICASRAKFTAEDTAALLPLDDAVTAAQSMYPTLTATPLYVKSYCTEKQQWEVTPCVSFSGAAEAMPDDVTTQVYRVLPAPGAEDDTETKLALFYSDLAGTPLPVLLERQFVPQSAGANHPSFYWEYTAERERLRAVPELLGGTAAEAEQALLAADLQIEEIAEPSDRPAGTVIYCSPKAGTKAAYGTKVQVYVSTGVPEN